MSAARPLDRLLPQTLALLFGLTGLAAGAAAVAADFAIGRPSSTSALGIVFMFPLALLAAVIGFAVGHVAGIALRQRQVTPPVPMKLYRVVLAIGLTAGMAAGAAAGARPVIRKERLHQPRVIAGDGHMDKQHGRPAGCDTARDAAVACDLVTRRHADAMLWNGRDVTVGCTREGRITVADAASGTVASADLTAFEYVRQVHATAVRQADGRESLALLARLRESRRRDVLVLFDADGRLAYQELIARQGDAAPPAPLSICAAGDVDRIIVDTGAPVTYTTR